jgi:hypothetical protein
MIAILAATFTILVINSVIAVWACNVHVSESRATSTDRSKS